MSVDGELLTDLRRLRKVRELMINEDSKVSASSSSVGVVLVIITGSRGTGKSTALRSVMDARYNDVTVFERLSQQTWNSFMKTSESSTTHDGNHITCSTRIQPCDLMSIQTLPLKVLHPEEEEKNTTLVDYVTRVLCVDDITALSYLLAANGSLNTLETMIRRLAEKRGVLLTCADEVSDVPLFVKKRASITLEYSVQTLSSAGVYRRLAAEGWPSADHEDVLSLKRVTHRMIGAAMSLCSTCRSSATPQVTIQDAYKAVDTLLHVATGSTGVASEFLECILPQDGDFHVLHGLDAEADRMVLLCSIHAAQCKDGWNHDDDVTGSSFGRVAREAVATTGILVCGPSGCGKSSLVEVVARRLPSIPFLRVRGSQLFSKYLGESEQRLRRAFAEARARQPAVLVIEDIEVVGPSRRTGSSESSSGGSVDVSKRMLAALLCEMDGVSSNRGVLVIGTSSMPDNMDGALVRQGRLETVIQMPLLRPEALRSMIDAFLNGFHLSDAEDASLKESIVEYLVAACTQSKAVGLQRLFREALERWEFSSALPPMDVWCRCVESCREHLV